MKVYKNECVGCTSMGLHCIGSSCPNKNVLHLYCDDCKSEEELYYFDGQELCIDCIIKQLEKVEE